MSFALLALCVRKVQPVGRWFEAYCQRRKSKQTLSYHSLNSSSSEESDQNLSEDEEDSHLLLTLDPKDWKVSTHTRTGPFVQICYTYICFQMFQI